MKTTLVCGADGFIESHLVKRLKKDLTCKVIADDPQDPNDEFRSVVVSE